MKSRLSKALLLSCVPLALVSAGCSPGRTSARHAATQGADAQDHARTPSRVVAKYYELAAAGRMQEAKELRLKYMTVKEPGFGPFSEVKIGTPESAWDSEKTIYEKGVRFLRADNEIVEDDRAEVIAFIREPDGKAVQVIHQLYKQENAWKLFSEVDANNSVCVREPAACHIVQTPAAVVNRYYHFSEMGEPGKARDLLAGAQSPDPETPLAGPLRRGGENEFRQGGVKFWELLREDVKGDRAEVLAVIRLGDATQVTVMHHLSRERGAWKIQNYFKAQIT
jgi:hypothetical protein